MDLGSYIWGHEKIFCVFSIWFWGLSTCHQAQQGKSNPNSICKVEINFNQELGVKRGFGLFLAFPESLQGFSPPLLPEQIMPW